MRGVPKPHIMYHSFIWKNTSPQNSAATPMYTEKSLKAASLRDEGSQVKRKKDFCW